MMGLYLLGLVMALIVSYVAKWFINIKERSFFILELPTYRSPRWNNLIPTMISKAKIFVFDAGKVIMVISLILWGRDYMFRVNQLLPPSKKLKEQLFLSFYQPLHQENFLLADLSRLNS